MAKPQSLNDSEIEKLIELVREATFIYDVRSNEHHDVIQITNFWNSVSTQFNDKCSGKCLFSDSIATV